ncbi:hypothetical protein BDV96DRAFT_676709 [Lophiotrema nucula]|uniref:Uncharacterized protein n=1 Tax=Lophiotrema nucula TaxID=690887 RepID=A0A6A5ZMV4_9PLEO|nr:hypothetical protein BDV96DRAFT_676709 [Lophiotrema nucula]
MEASPRPSLTAVALDNDQQAYQLALRSERSNNNEQTSQLLLQSEPESAVAEQDIINLQRDCDTLGGWTNAIHGPDTRPHVLEAQRRTRWEITTPYDRATYERLHRLETQRAQRRHNMAQQKAKRKRLEERVEQATYERFMSTPPPTLNDSTIPELASQTTTGYPTPETSDFDPSPQQMAEPLQQPLPNVPAVRSLDVEAVFKELEMARILYPN